MLLTQYALIEPHTSEIPSRSTTLLQNTHREQLLVSTSGPADSSQTRASRAGQLLAQPMSGCAVVGCRWQHQSGSINASPQLAATADAEAASRQAGDGVRALI